VILVLQWLMTASYKGVALSHQQVYLNMHFSMMQCVAVCCSVLQCVANVLQHVTAYCSAFQCVAV